MAGWHPAGGRGGWRSPPRRTPRRSVGVGLFLWMFVEGADASGVAELVQFDDVEHAVAVLASVEQRVAVGTGQECFLGEDQVRSEFQREFEVSARLRLAVRPTIGPTPAARDRGSDEVDVPGISRQRLEAPAKRRRCASWRGGPSAGRVASRARCGSRGRSRRRHARCPVGSACRAGPGTSARRRPR
jgi:hypothetical protein